MDSSGQIIAIFKSAKQYRENKSDKNVLLKLNRNLDTLIALTRDNISPDVFNPQDPLTMQCTSILVELLNGGELETELLERILVLLTNLVQDVDLCKALNESYSLVNVLSILCVRKISDNNLLLIKCLTLLQKITYVNKVGQQDGFVDELIKFIMRFIPRKQASADHSHLCTISVYLLANVCRHNFTIQTFVKNLGNIRPILMALFGFLEDPTSDLVIPALSVLTSLCIHDEIGQQLFSSDNGNQTFMLIFNILINDRTEKRYAVDLVMDLIRYPHISDLLISFPHLEITLEQILHLFKSKSITDAGKLFELLLAFCSVSKLRSIVCQCVFKGSDLKSIMMWIQSSNSSVSVLALTLVKELYEEAIDSNNELNLQIDDVLPCCTEILMAPLPITQNHDIKYNGQKIVSATQNYDIKYHCQKIVSAIKLLSVLSNEESIKEEVYRSFDAEICYKIVEYQLQHNKVINVYLTSDKLDSWSNVGVEVVLYTLDLMLTLKKNIPKMDTKVISLLQEQRLMPVLSRGLMSESRDIIQLTLKLLLAGTQIPEFPSVMLGDSILANNQRKERDSMNGSFDLKSSNNAMKPSIPEVNSTETFQHPRIDTRNTNIDGEIENLIDKMNSDLDIKNLKVSRVIDIYEVKIQSLQTKENHLQDLLEAKSLAVAQSDRLLSQYRSKRGEFEAETQQLKNLIKDSECKSDQYLEELNEMTVKKDKAVSTLQGLQAEMLRYQTISDDYDRLLCTHEELQKRNDTLQRTVTLLQQEYDTLKAVHDLITKHNEQLKEQNATSAEQLEKLGDLCKSHKKQLDNRDIKLNEVNKTIKTLEGERNSLKEEKAEREKQIADLTKNVKQVQHEKKELKHKITALVSDCSTYEHELKQKTNLLKEQKDTIDKHNHIAALIHNLSGATGPPPASFLNTSSK